MGRVTMLAAALLIVASLGTARAGALEDYMRGQGPPPGDPTWGDYYHRPPPPAGQQRHQPDARDRDSYSYPR